LRKALLACIIFSFSLALAVVLAGPVFTASGQAAPGVSGQPGQAMRHDPDPPPPVVLQTGLELPLVDSEWLLIVSRSQQRITAYRQGQKVKTYPVSTGKAETLTPLGWWKIVEKFPLSPPGVYGTRWLGWERWNPREGRYEWYRESPPFGIHGTNEPEKIGTAVSAGCVRLRNQDVEELYEMIPVGTYVLVVE